MLDFEIIIVGAGPSGSAAALQLANLDPDLSQKVLLLDKAVFPRSKLCAGGLTKDAEIILRQLRINIELPSVPIHTSRFFLPTGSLILRQRSQFRIVRRVDFDHYLFLTAHERGIVTRDGEAVEDIRHTSDALIVRTSKNEYRTKILIGADGANSIVRRLLKMSRQGRLMMALEILVPGDQLSIPELTDNVALFDFVFASKHIPGYFWIFPRVSQDPRVFSIGLMEAPFLRTEFSSLRNTFARWLKKLGLDLEQFDLQAHPALRYASRGLYSEQRVLLAGDAVGIDPLFGEGITSGLALGTIAAQSALDAIRKGNFSFADYEKRIRTSLVGTLMRRRCLVARRLYANEILGRHGLPYGDLLNWVAPIDSLDKSATITWEPFPAS